MVLLAAAAVGGPLRFRFQRLNLPLFLLGAGFLLLETKGVTQISLLFGSTWVVNLLVISSVLLVLFLVNLLVLRREAIGRPLSLRAAFLPLAAALILFTFLPVSALSALPAALQWLAGGLLVGLPIGLAGVVFPSLFARAADPAVAFSSNLLGAIVGGALEYATMAFGIQSLGFLATVIYLVAFLLIERRPAA
jgi:hypothetical protein